MGNAKEKIPVPFKKGRKKLSVRVNQVLETLRNSLNPKTDN